MVLVRSWQEKKQQEKKQKVKQMQNNRNVRVGTGKTNFC